MVLKKSALLLMSALAISACQKQTGSSPAQPPVPGSEKPSEKSEPETTPTTNSSVSGSISIEQKPDGKKPEPESAGTPISDETAADSTVPPAPVPPAKAPSTEELALKKLQGEWSLKRATCGPGSSAVFAQELKKKIDRTFYIRPDSNFWDVKNSNGNCDRISFIGNYSIEKDALKAVFSMYSNVPGCPAPAANSLQAREYRIYQKTPQDLSLTQIKGPSTEYCKNGLAQTLYFERVR